MDCQHLDDFYEFFLLGTFQGDACAEIAEHAGRECPQCLARLREAARVVYMLAQWARPVRPGPKLKSQVLRQIRKR